jgi:hypothetical protein
MYARFGEEMSDSSQLILSLIIKLGMKSEMLMEMLKALTTTLILMEPHKLFNILPMPMDSRCKELLFKLTMDKHLHLLRTHLRLLPLRWLT